MGFITNNERYNQVIDIWTHANAKLTNSVMKTLSSDRQVKLSKTQFLPTLKKGFLYWSTLFLLTVLVKVWPIPRLKLLMPDI